MARKGDWIQTSSGRQFWPLDPRVGEIYIDDIAQGLSLACRFNGQCLDFYSVAQHSVLMARYIEPEFKLWALLHDASEAYIADLSRPVKKYVVDYGEIEDRIMRKVCQKFGLPPTMPPRVKEVDNSILLDEREALMAQPRNQASMDWRIDAEPLGVRIVPWSWRDARREFLRTFRELST